MQYLLDENVTPLYQAALINQNPDLHVWRVGAPGAPPRGTLDPEILLWCEEWDFTLVTNNRKSCRSIWRITWLKGITALVSSF